MSKSANDFPEWVRHIVVLMIIIGAIFIIKKEKQTEKWLLQHGWYTIATTKGVGYGRTLVRNLMDYEYKVKGTLFTSYVKIESRKGLETNGGKYLLLFDPKNPRKHKILLDKHVKSVGLWSSDGFSWERVPDYVELFQE